MDFRGWEKLSEDAKTCTLKHPKGHTMTIAVKALPKILQEQIKRLKFAEGGEVDEKEGISQQGRDVRHAHKAKRRGDKEEHAQGMDMAKDEARGRAQFEREAVKPKIKGLADGGAVRKSNGFWDSEAGKQSLAEANKESDNVRSIKRSGSHPDKRSAYEAHQERVDRHMVKKHYAKGTPDGTVQSDDSQDQSDDSQDQSAQPAATHITINAGAPAQPQAQAQSAPQAPPVPPIAQYAPPAPAPVVSTPAKGPINASGGLGNQAGISLQSIQSGQEGIEEQSAVDAAKAQAAVPIEQERIQKEQQMAAQNAQAYQDVKKHTDEFNDYMTKNPINPKHYQESMGTGDKFATGIGLFLGGLGVPFGGHNFAFDNLQKQIDRDVQAQEKNADNRKTIWGAYKELYKDNNVATALAKASTNDIAAHKIALADAQIGTAASNARAKMAISKLGADSEQLRQNAAGLIGSRGIGPQTSNGGPSGAGPSGGGNPGAKEAGFGPAGSSVRPQAPSAPGDRVLAPGAQAKYDWAMSKFNTVQSPEQKAAIEKEYKEAFQVDRALDQIDDLYPQLMSKATLGGYLSEKINPAVVGGLVGAGVEGAGALAAPATGGASLMAAVPAAMVSGAGATGLSAALKTGLRAAGGQTQSQYETAANSLESIVGGALSSAGLTPTEKASIAKDFLPTKFDSEETAKDKLEKLKQKLISLTKVATLKSMKMTNDSMPRKEK